MEEKKTNQLEETEAAPIEVKKETIHFPWAWAIIFGVIIVCMIVFFVLAKVFDAKETAASSSQIISSSL